MNDRRAGGDVFETSAAASSGLSINEIRSSVSRRSLRELWFQLLVIGISCVPTYTKAVPMFPAESKIENRQAAERGDLLNVGGNELLINAESAPTDIEARSPALIDDSARLPVDPQTGLPSRPPLPGENLGYSRQQSLRRLDGQVVEFLEAIRVLYSEGGALADKKRTLELFDVHVTRRWDGRRASITSGPATYSDVFVDGVFSRRGWKGYYTYSGWERPLGTKWSVAVRVDIDPEMDCVDSRAAEGFLGLPLVPILSGRAIPIGPDEWDRHGQYGSALANSLGGLTPAVRLGFVKGCLVSVVVGSTYLLNEIDDEKYKN